MVLQIIILHNCGKCIFLEVCPLQFTLAFNCLQVHKQGVALGRSVDLSKFGDYDELKAELDKMFEFEGELVSANKNWQIVYTDNEGDMMLVGDDPWE